VTTARPANLDARYGRTPGRRRRGVVIAILVAVAVLGAAIAWVFWVGLLTPASTIDNQDVGYHRVDDTTLQITEQLSTDPGTALTCTFEGLNTRFAIVGWKVVDIPPSTERLRHVTVEIRTSERAVTGTVGSCWRTKG
jgi:hypothetical protein